MNGEIYLWGEGKDGPLRACDEGKTTVIPTKVGYFDDIEVKCISLGLRSSFVVSYCNEEKDDEGEKQWILEGNKEMNINKNYTKDLRNKQLLIFVRNFMLFGDLEWNLMMRNPKDYSAFPLYTSSFINSLQVTNDGTIELVDLNGIDKQYHSEISNATYLLLVNEEKVVIQKEYVDNADALYVFKETDLQNIKFQIPLNEKGTEGESLITVSIYVQPKKELNFYLLKQFCITNI